jgi:hypothetical protein
MMLRVCIRAMSINIWASTSCKRDPVALCSNHACPCGQLSQGAWHQLCTWQHSESAQSQSALVVLSLTGTASNNTLLHCRI